MKYYYFPSKADLGVAVIRQNLEAFNERIEAWKNLDYRQQLVITDLLSKGRDSKVFSFNESPRTKVFIIHSALLSSLQMNKVLRNDVYKSIQDGLLNI